MNILILSYYYPPVNSIAALRPKSWAENWSAAGTNVHVITKAWDGSEKNWNDMLSNSKENETRVFSQNEHLKIHYLPYRKPEYSTNPIKRKIDLLIKYLQGTFNPEIDTLQFYNYALQLHRDQKFNMIIATSPPLNILNLAQQLSEKTQVPWIADFRDFENATFLNKNKISLKERVLLNFKVERIKSTLRSSSYITSATNTINDFFGTSLNIPHKEILNGFENKLLGPISLNKNEKFTISVIGTIYPSQDFLLFVNSLKKLNTKIQESIQLNLIGIKAIKGVALKTKAVLDDTKISCIYTDIIPRTDAVQIGKSSDILFYPAWKGYKGVYSGKIFEYLAFRKNILIAPGDEDVIDELIYKTNSGKIANTEKEVVNIISEWFSEWKKNNGLTCTSSISEIKKYSREFQAQKLLEVIKGLAPEKPH